ncbi:splicing factor 3B subunit 2 [Agrilus planipennis]|uniref:Splicing factor 3B subunit 2 n=1 Tax=Agrilus planipennis TaxID=224129 RepID=A0A1W4WFP3_AGRPL|nr:splicing factor 3B subunit 2 [Agrilus planipennis]
MAQQNSVSHPIITTNPETLIPPPEFCSTSLPNLPNVQQPPPLLLPPNIQPNSGNDKQLPSLLSLKVDPPDQLIEKTDSEEVVLPQALEQVLALKDRRETELGSVEVENEIQEQPQDITEVEVDSSVSKVSWGKEEKLHTPEDTDKTNTTVKEKKTKLSKNKKKKRNKNKKRSNAQNEKASETDGNDNSVTQADESNVEIEYIQESLRLHELAPQYRQFFHIFEAFKISDPIPDIAPPQLITPTLSGTKTSSVTGDQFQDEADENEEKVKEDKTKMSKRKLKKLTRLSVAELKQLVTRPDVVEMHDITARDPKLLVQLKAHRNTVQVPRHWCFKRKYLQGKRGIEKPPFNLPDFIKKTGIMEMRASLQDKDESKTLKAKMRERARPKLGKIDIDYQKLHDAFFKWQTKPKMTIHGDLYYEGKEFETRLKEKKPGDLSEELRTALGMPIGPNAHKVPPPWLIAMQRYGPPPSYPNLKIPGLNAPIPEGCSFGYHAGGWGKPPVDEGGKPLYGDVFGTNQINIDDAGEDINIDRSLWGELESESEEESEEEDEEGEELQQPTDETGLVTPAEGLVTPSGLTSIPAGMETPEAIELRKKKIENEMEGTETPVLYHVIPEKRNERIGGAMMASSHVYDMTGVGAPPPAVISAKRGGTSAVEQREGMVELALDPSELEMDSDAMAARYEQQMRENQSQLQKEDLSDMLAEHVAKQKSKRKRQTMDTKQSKKYKEFKF